LARKNIIFKGSFSDEEKISIRKKMQLNQQVDNEYLVKSITSAAMKSEYLLQEILYFEVSKKIRLLGDMFEEAFTMEEQFDGELFGNLNFGFALNLTNENEQEFIFQTIKWNHLTGQALLKI
jgi:hypothetical protein